MTTRKEQLEELKQAAREAKDAGKTAISVPVDLLAALFVREAEKK